MFTITDKELVAPNIYKMNVKAARIAKSAQPGQFIIIMGNKTGERIPLTICDCNRLTGTVTIVFQVVGKSTAAMANLEVGDAFSDVAGPLGKPCDFVAEPIDHLKNQKIVFIGGGVGLAPVYPQVKWMHEHGIEVDVILGARNADLIFMEKEFQKIAENLYFATDDGTKGFKGNVTGLLRSLIESRGKKYDKVVAIGPLVMMKSVSEFTKKTDVRTIVSLNPLMVCGMGMCGACRISLEKHVKFACFDGPEFDGHLVDFVELMRRQIMYKTEEASNEGKRGDEMFERNNEPISEYKYQKRIPMREQNPKERIRNFAEVTLGYNEQEAIAEAKRCINCKKPLCVTQCPVNIDVPGFINHIKTGSFAEAAKVLYAATSLPAICGRVCPQETQCEAPCILGKKSDPVAIGRLERFIGDWAMKNNAVPKPISAPAKNQKVAIIGSGPAGLTCAAELAQLGYTVKIFEALHYLGGVLEYGIPEFRLPKELVVKPELKNLEKLGVEIETNVIVGKTITINQLMHEEGYKAVFIGSGAGLPMFMNVPGENLNGVLSSNEFLTRNNLMKAFHKKFDTPIKIGRRVCVVGGGNVAMDAARTAVRLGSEVSVIYRRSEKELPARKEEIEHAKEEGINFSLLTNPIEIIGDENGWVKGLRCIKMELGEPDNSGRRRPAEIKNSEFDIECDTVIMAIGTSPNPLIASTTESLNADEKFRITVNNQGLTNIEGVFAGGDVVTNSATVILAMGAGKTAAKAIDKYLETMH